MPSTIPQKLWDNVFQHLSSFTVSDFTQIFSKIRADDKTKAHAAVWRAIFQNETWLQMVDEMEATLILLGYDLDLFYRSQGTKPARLLLLIDDPHGDSEYEMEAFQQSLQPGFACKKSKQIWEKGNLEIRLLFYNDEMTWDPTCHYSNLLFSSSTPLKTFYCLWNDKKRKLREIKSRDIRGIDGEICLAQNLKPQYFLNICSGLEKPVQLSFICLDPKYFSWKFMQHFFNYVYTTRVDRYGGSILDRCEFRNQRHKEIRYRVQDWNYLLLFGGANTTYEMACRKDEDAKRIRDEKLSRENGT